MTYCDNYSGSRSGLPWLAHLGGCDRCRDVAWDRHERPRIYLHTVPGGFNDTAENRFHRNFDKGMYEYEKARAEGLQPKATTVDAVREAQSEVKSQERALEKLKRVADVSEVSVAEGVEV